MVFAKDIWSGSNRSKVMLLAAGRHIYCDENSDGGDELYICEDNEYIPIATRYMDETVFCLDGKWLSEAEFDRFLPFL